MVESKTALFGVIEGFYGRPWPHESRLSYADYLQRLGLNSYLYCPKSDPFLRKRWQEDWPAATREQLCELAEVYSGKGLAWGVGLSPYALYENYGATERLALKRKVRQLAELQMPILAVLFDDMPGALDDLAARQAQIVSDISAWSPGTRLIVCPTYYSFDPVLEKYFGTMPDNYWRQLGEQLPVETDIFWTGNRVCSEAITAVDVTTIVEQLGRKVMLWDNYPVNDGALRSNFIYSKKLSRRDLALPDLTAGHYCNPMNQPQLSLPALEGLAELHGKGQADEHWLEQLFGAQTYRQWQRDKDDFETLGLTGIPEQRRAELARLYAGFSGSAAAELAAWLRGEYTFDPACLTD